MATKLFLTALAALLLATTAHAQPLASEGDFVVHDFKFHTGETLPTLRLHYTTFGRPIRDIHGHVVNAVLIMHGTGGNGHSLVRPEFSGVLFAPGGLLDANRYYLILPDDLGHGKSSKPSDGLRMRFPKYDYADMVEAEHLLVTQGLDVDHLRLVMGTSMGCMHAFMWGERWPGQMDALMPLACLPVPIAGRNRLWRAMAIEAIKADPAWMGGDYAAEPISGLRGAESLLVIAGSAPLVMQKTFADPAAADAYARELVGQSAAMLDADDLIYALDSSRTYDPEPGLGAIAAPLVWINSADDFINPPELGIAEQAVKKIPRGRFILIPASLQTHGHGTHTLAAVWQDHLAELLNESAPHAP